MSSTTIEQGIEPAHSAEGSRLERLRHVILHAAHYLPSQGPIEVFVHHNTLHSFEHLSFDEAVKAGGRLYGCHAYMPEEQYRQKLEHGRIHIDDLKAALADDLGAEVDTTVGSFGTKQELRLAMLRYPLRTGSCAELRWVIAETDALRRFRHDVQAELREKMLDETRAWVLRDLRHGNSGSHSELTAMLVDALEQFDLRSIESWDDRRWENLVLNFLWHVCYAMAGEVDAPQQPTDAHQIIRHRDALLEATGHDSDIPVNQTLISLCSAYLDQGFADYELPFREQGLFASFLKLYETPFTSPTRWHAQIHAEACRLARSQMTPLKSIEESLRVLGIDDAHAEEYLTRTLLAQRGWAGMMWQMESNAEWAPHPAPEGSLIEYLAIRLVLERISLAEGAQAWLGFHGPLSEVLEFASNLIRPEERHGRDQRAFLLFQMAQVCGWTPQQLHVLPHQEWRQLLAEMEAFSGIERRRIFHHAFERRFRNRVLDAVLLHARSSSVQARAGTESELRPAYQLVTCIDEREESFRRHLEEIDPDAETLAIAGFFGVAMYYRGSADAHFKPLCPANIKPQRYVVEQPLFSLMPTERVLADARRRIGQASHQVHRSSRTVGGMLLIGLLGPLAAIPLVARVLFPRTTAWLNRIFSRTIQTDKTELLVERTEPQPGPCEGGIGYTVSEMANIVEGLLRAIGLTAASSFSRIVIICGHGSSSLNNPHEAAHDCGACGGARGGPNARAFAQMANDLRVRRLLDERGVHIPDGTFFVGAYHNTCNDAVIWFDLDRIPIRCRGTFERAKRAIDEARARDAHERCRRFESAPLGLSFNAALRHVEARAEDLSQTRPEYGHATNAMCFVGRRHWSRGLFLDRRAFLSSYDPAQDDERSSILERLLQAVIPVCGGISLEYYFSYVDPTGYGCGTKLPHNITSLIGVMDGAASDLRTGLPWQMVEIHEPVRLLFVIQTSPEAMQRIINDNPIIARLVEGDWVQIAVFDETACEVRRYVRGQFVQYFPESDHLPIASSSVEWYGGHRDHLPFASIVAPAKR